jgi:hypothetical protein
MEMDAGLRLGVTVIICVAAVAVGQKQKNNGFILNRVINHK